MINKIIHEYSELYNNLIDHNRLVRPTELGYSGSASADAVHEFFKKIGLDKYKSFLDLGSGDGKIVLIASLFTKATGIEIDEELIKISEDMKSKLNLNNAEFFKKDFLLIDILGYDVIFINPDQPMYEIEKKLRNEMTAEQRLIVFGGLYKPLNMKLENEFKIDGVLFGIYSNN